MSATQISNLEPEVFEITGLTAGYGATKILRDVTLTIAPGETVCVLGANGAGKTTLVGAIAGLTDVFEGQIRLGQTDLVGRSAESRAATGIGVVPEGRRLFPKLSVEENLLIAFYHRRRTISPEKRIALLDRTYELFPILAERRNQPAGTLSGGQQQMVSVGRVLLLEPKLLLLDEPSFGLAPIIIDRIYEVVKRLADSKELSILLVEQSAGLALGVSDRAYVLQNGAVVAEGRSSDLKSDPSIKAAYLGEIAG